MVWKERFGAMGIHIPYIFPIKWGASWSYLEFPNQMIVEVSCKPSQKHDCVNRSSFSARFWCWLLFDHSWLKHIKPSIFLRRIITHNLIYPYLIFQLVSWAQCQVLFRPGGASMRLNWCMNSMNHLLFVGSIHNFCRLESPFWKWMAASIPFLGWQIPKSPSLKHSKIQQLERHPENKNDDLCNR